MSADDVDLFDTKPQRYRLQQAAARRPGPATRQTLFARLRESAIALLPLRPVPVRFDTIAADENGQMQVPVLDAQQHHPRNLRLFCQPGSLDTPFWVNLIIGGSGAEPLAGSTADDTLFSKAFGELPNALTDLYALRDFFQPARYGDPFTASPGSQWRSPGYFSHTLWLADPDEAAIIRGIDSLGHWLAVNSDDPEFDSFQINFYFSGHAGRSDKPGSSYLLVKGGAWPTHGVVEEILGSLIKYGVHAKRCYITLFLDCCFAGMVARDFVVALTERLPQLEGRLKVDSIAWTRIYSSCLDDEESFDRTNIANSLFTGAYLRENSAARSRRRVPRLEEIALRTGGRQHPLMLQMDTDGLIYRFPALNGFGPEVKARVLAVGRLDDAVLHKIMVQERLRRFGIAEQEDNIHQMDFEMRRATWMRDACAIRELSDTPPPLITYAERRTKWD